MLCEPEYLSEVIPVDIAINSLICIGWRVGTWTETTRLVLLYPSSTKYLTKLTKILDLKMYQCSISLAVKVRKWHGDLYWMKGSNCAINIRSKRAYGTLMVCLNGVWLRKRLKYKHFFIIRRHDNIQNYPHIQTDFLPLVASLFDWLFNALFRSEAIVSSRMLLIQNVRQKF